ncbi:uncharacterized protein LOC128327509 [Hemicordylus capensis]|uniref:uncharacterized protein LOC128327509 n=1 Tax=Hemicordylus capensis TaxID=884348 RepID=UPI0023046C52|nr:uncharacterized protein LOC128327509 [Hemicordylus capensis]
MVKGRHAKHGFYMFNYVYSSSVPNNQTQIKKEEDDSKDISNATPESDTKHVPKKPTDSHTASGKSEGSKELVETRSDRKPEDPTPTESSQNLYGQHGNTQHWSLYQHHIQFTVGKGGNETTTGDTIIEVDGSGDAGFPGQVDSHLGIVIGNGQHNAQGKDHKDTRGNGYNKPLGKETDGKSGISSKIKSSKDGYIKTRIKENDADVIQKVSSYIPKKSIDVQSKDYSEVDFKGKTDVTNKKPGREESGHLELLDKGKRDNSTSKGHPHSNTQSNISLDLLMKIGNKINGSKHTNFSDMDEIKSTSKKVVSNTKVQKKSEDGYATIIIKLNGQKDRSGVTKTTKEGKVRDDITSGSHMKATGVIKPHKKEGTVDGIDGRSNNHIEMAGVSQIHKEEGEAGVTGKFISQVEDPVYTRTGKTSQQEIMLSGKLNSSVDTFGVTKLQPTEGDQIITLRGVSDIQVSDPGTIQQGQKGIGGIGIIHRKSNTGKQGFGFTKAHQKEVGSHEKINRNAHAGKLDDPDLRGKDKDRPGVTFQEGSKDIKKVKINYSKDTGIAVGLERSKIDSSSPKEEHRGQTSSGIKSALSLHHGLHSNIKHGQSKAWKSQGHSSSTLKNDGESIRSGKKGSQVHPGTYGGSTTKRYHGHSGTWQRKRSQHDTKSKRVRKVHGKESSSSSESEENSRHDSRQSYEDYQNDKPDSYQSAESAEQDLSAESNQTGDHSRMEGQETYSREDSHEHQSN